MPSVAGLFAYVGPDTYLPVTSALSALVGTFLMLWRAGFPAVLKRCIGRFQSGNSSYSLSPYFRLRHQPDDPTDVPREKTGALDRDHEPRIEPAHEG